MPHFARGPARPFGHDRGLARLGRRHVVPQDRAGHDQIGADVVAEVPHPAGAHEALRWCVAHAQPSRYLRGSEILPSIADAVTVAGEARHTSAFALPMRPWKLRLLDEMHRSLSASKPRCPPG